MGYILLRVFVSSCEKIQCLVVNGQLLETPESLLSMTMASLYTTEMKILQSAALVLAIIGGACLLVFAGRGVNWLAWKLGNRRRAVKDAAREACVRSELAPGEELLWIDRWKPQILAGLFFTLFGFVVFWFFTVLLVFLCREKPSLLMFCVPMICFGLPLMNLGTFAMFRRGSNYFFVTNRRLAFRGRSLMGLHIRKDVQSCQIREVALLDYRMYLFHVHYRVRVTFDNGNGGTRREEILPERAPEYFAGTVARIGNAPLCSASRSIL